jgi:regulator of sigma E protease
MISATFGTLIAFLVAICVLVFVHELGHYLAARWCGVKVLQFSIGFGPGIERKFGKDQTKWTLAAIPLGGYVKMLDEEVVEAEGGAAIAPTELHRAFNRQPIWKRCIIVIAGPLANFLFAIAAYAVLSMSGVAEPAAKLAEPTQGSVAAAAGVTKGDFVVQIDGDKVHSWNGLRMAMLDAAIDKRTVELNVENAGAAKTVRIRTSDIPPADLEKDFLRVLGLELDGGQLVIGQLAPGGAAEQAGLLTGDLLLSIEGKAITKNSAAIDLIKQSAGKELSFLVERNYTQLQIKVIPKATVDADKTVGRIGAALGQKPQMVIQERGVIESLVTGVRQTWDMSVFSLRMLGKMLTGNLSWRNLSGPITIADYAGKTAKIGWEAYVGLLALISVSLGVLNLLPVPVLDGGHLVYYGLEAVRGKPLSKRVMELSRGVGVGLIGLMMVVAISNDIIRKLSL